LRYVQQTEPNLEFELEQFGARTSHHVTFNKEARERFLQFALSSTSSWARNFRDLNAAVVRMATLAQGVRISTEIVEEETQRLSVSWSSLERGASEDILPTLLNSDQLAQMDLFDRTQLAHLVHICQQSRSPSDADRLRKYLARFGIEWNQIQSA
jgi:transcriptional regulatory protein RtcR